MFSSKVIADSLEKGFETIFANLQDFDEKIINNIENILMTQQALIVDSQDEDFLSLYKKGIKRFYDLWKNTYLDVLQNPLGDENLSYKRFLFMTTTFLEYLNPEIYPHFHIDHMHEWQLGDFEKVMAFLERQGMPKIANEEAFEVGKNLAPTKGFVVFENEVMQLIRFSSNKNFQYQHPIFIVPPWINKYYIFDLSREKSFIHWLCNQGYVVYCISWINADKSYSSLGLKDFIDKGISQSLRFIKELEKSDAINAIGYCVGGVALYVYLSQSELKQDKVIGAVTFLATPFNFEKLDSLRLFICEDQLDYIESFVETNGYFSGEQMVQTFSMLRAKEMIIQNLIDQLYYDKNPPAIDFLYWNADATNIPGKMHLEYLKHVFLQNPFMKKNGKILNYEMADLINTPAYLLSTLKDYIVPWQASYDGLSLFQNATFTLAGSGHVAGIINPPSRNKYNYYTNSSCNKCEQKWLENAQMHEGSWWNHWINWIKPYTGETVKNTDIEKFNLIEPAPGRYALTKA